MTRWEPGARNRLEQAALELFVERGFEQATVSEITARAGLTERTFFRHFTDKREVLFSGQDELQAFLVDTVIQAPASLAPLDAIAKGLQHVAGAVFDSRRAHAQQRKAVIDTVEGLRERELLKLAALSGAIVGALRSRGVAEPTASLTAETGIIVFKIAFERWLDPTNNRDLAELIPETLEQLKIVTSSL
jgi:AcrR family transcriptional regulator